MTAALIEEVDLLQLGGKALQKQLADPRLDLGVHKLSRMTNQRHRILLGSCGCAV